MHPLWQVQIEPFRESPGFRILLGIVLPVFEGVDGGIGRSCSLHDVLLLLKDQTGPVQDEGVRTHTSNKS